VIVILDPNMVYRYYGSDTNQIFSIIEEILSETTWITGDINFDETIDILDVILIVNSIMSDDYNYYSDLKPSIIFAPTAPAFAIHSSDIVFPILSKSALN